MGLISACGAFFSREFPVSYAQVVWVFTIFCMAVSNQGLDSLINISVPVLVGLYPLAIVLVCLGLFSSSLARPQNIMRPVMSVALVFGIMDGLKTAGLMARDTAWMSALPFSSQGLGWLAPAVIVLVLALIVDRLRFGKTQHA